jgi:hypothetical protein
MRITITSPKGGSGTSTVVAATALVLSETGTVAIVGDDGDLPALFGCGGDPGLDEYKLGPAEDFTLAPGITWTSTAADIDRFDHVISTRERLHDSEAVIVVRGCYLALRRAVRTDVLTYSGAVFVDEGGRALGAHDVANVLGVPVLSSVSIRASVARTIDAGVLATRLPAELRRPVREMLRRLGYVAAVDHSEV